MNVERINLPIRNPLRTKSGDGMNLPARWQTAVEVVSGDASQKLRLELAHFLSELFLTSTHGSDDNDHSVNIVRPSDLPVSA